jgi:hypothetical protein
MTWRDQQEPLNDATGFRFELLLDDRPASVEDVVRSWRSDAAFREYFSTLLTDVPYTAFRWETPAVTSSTLSKPFEFVVLDSPGLERRVEPHVFDEHFRGTMATVVSFANLSGDAVMVVPRPLDKSSSYGHLAAFLRKAPDFQRQTLWQLVGDAMSERIGAKPVWLSTAGAGVSWLHVRLDDRPKYYGYEPYRRLP